MTRLGGKIRADFSNPDLNKPGMICFQVHAGQYPAPGDYRIEWRNIRFIAEP